MAPTMASREALSGLRDLTMIKWYIIPLLAIVLYIYAVEIKKARQTRDWNAIYAGLTVFGLDFINETWNGMVFAITNYSAFWTTPGDTALRTMVGWNIEIMFMFSIAGIIYYHSLLEWKDDKILGLPNRWAFAIGFAGFCVFVECILNIGGHLVWVYPWWNLSFTGIWLIFLVGYFFFFAGANLVIGMEYDKNKKITLGIIYAIPITLNIIFLGVLGWVY
ncbi:MAG: hypothetical protein GF383_13070 [Candidatus Lokiarchaeota archaeon]|nr:hypothetical protein [Candidatus Lokiarchaeota archaeon]MBD3342049.1 hypothetical protein [Candidatus Lokiarchaeota archaeon]